MACRTSAWLLAALVAASSASQADTPVLHFVTKPFPPYTLTDPAGQPAGPLVDLLQAACGRLGWHCVIEALPWRRALALAEQGEVDGIFPLVDSPARRASFHLAPPVVTARYVLLGRRGQALAPGGDPHELAGRTLAAYGPSDATATLRQLLAGVPGARAEVETDHRAVLRKLAAGRYGDDGLALVNEAVASRLLAEGSLGGLQPVMSVKDLAYSYAFVPGRVDAGQRLAFAQALRALCAEGTTADLFKPSGLPAAACRHAP